MKTRQAKAREGTTTATAAKAAAKATKAAAPAKAAKATKATKAVKPAVPAKATKTSVPAKAAKAAKITATKAAAKPAKAAPPRKPPAPKTTQLKTTRATPPTATKAPPPDADAKRARRYRATCPVALRERMERASSQRLYLVHHTIHDDACELIVLGSTGNCYTVKLASVPTCTCMDYARHRDMCKHILFVTLKVLGLPPSNPLAFQKAYTPAEVEELRSLLTSRRVGGTVLANDAVRQRYEAHTKKKSGEDEEEVAEDDGAVPRRKLEADCNECPICFDTLLDCPVSELTYCRSACGINFHADCIRRWMASSATFHRSGATCPNCRQPWQTGEKSTATTSKEKYLNLGSLQGQSSVRDTSSYHRGNRY